MIQVIIDIIIGIVSSIYCKVKRVSNVQIRTWCDYCYYNIYPLQHLKKQDFICSGCGRPLKEPNGEQFKDNDYYKMNYIVSRGIVLRKKK